MTLEAPTLNDELTQAAAALSAGTVGVSKADDMDKKPNPFAKKDDDKKDDKDDKADKAEKTEKAEDCDDEEEDKKAEKGLSAAEVEAIVTKALAPYLELLTGVTKSLDVLDEKLTATQGFQKATVGVLTQFKDVSEETRTLARQNVEVSKGLQADVTTIGEQTAPRKTLSTVALEQVEKSATVPTEIDMGVFRETFKSLEVHDRVTLLQEAKAGNFSNFTPAQRKQLGV